MRLLLVLAIPLILLSSITVFAQTDKSPNAAGSSSMPQPSPDHASTLGKNESLSKRSCIPVCEGEVPQGTCVAGPEPNQECCQPNGEPNACYEYPPGEHDPYYLPYGSGEQSPIAYVYEDPHYYNEPYVVYDAVPEQARDLSQPHHEHNYYYPNENTPAQFEPHRHPRAEYIELRDQNSNGYQQYPNGAASSPGNQYPPDVYGPPIEQPPQGGLTGSNPNGYPSPGCTCPHQHPQIGAEQLPNQYPQNNFQQPFGAQVPYGPYGGAPNEGWAQQQGGSLPQYPNQNQGYQPFYGEAGQRPNQQQDGQWYGGQQPYDPYGTGRAYVGQWPQMQAEPTPQFSGEGPYGLYSPRAEIINGGNGQFPLGYANEGNAWAYGSGSPPSPNGNVPQSMPEIAPKSSPESSTGGSPAQTGTGREEWQAKLLSSQTSLQIQNIGHTTGQNDHPPQFPSENFLREQKQLLSQSGPSLKS